MIGTGLHQAFEGVDFLPAQPCKLRDGVALVADVYRPQGKGPWPVLLMRQPYGRDIASTVVYAHPTWWARRGFMVVIQDVRGRGDSEGSFYAFRHEIEDGVVHPFTPDETMESTKKRCRTTKSSTGGSTASVAPAMTRPVFMAPRL